MAQPQKRIDGYGRPLPMLAEAREESLYDHTLNKQARKLVHEHLMQHYEQLLRRGVHAEITLTLGIKNGVIMEEVKVGITHTIYCEREGT